MDNNKEYMAIGEIAKKMNTTVRTLQYYDTEGLLKPSGESEGGRRLYTYKDMIQLHQIQSLKSLGFSLNDIKNKIIYLDTPKEVINTLNEQSMIIQKQIDQLTNALSAIDALKHEVIQMKTVDFKKYADIIVNLQMNNEYYWLIKHFDNETLDHIRNHFNKESGLEFMKRFNQLNEKILKLKKENIPYDDEKTLELAKEFWNLIIEFTNGDMSLLPKLMEFGNLMDENEEWVNQQKNVNEYLQPALSIYFQKIGVNPFEVKNEGNSDK